MAVQGYGFWVGEAERRRLHVVVTGDDKRSVVTIRDEVVPAVFGDHVDDLEWQVDQYTQETIGVALAADGWEVFSTAGVDATDAEGPAASPVYLVRR